MTKSEFLEYVEHFLVKTGMSATTFGIKAKAEPNFVFSLRSGRECREDVQARVINFIEENENEQKQ
mgnify:CR=1 FL=1